MCRTAKLPKLEHPENKLILIVVIFAFEDIFFSKTGKFKIKLIINHISFSFLGVPIKIMLSSMVTQNSSNVIPFDCYENKKVTLICKSNYFHSR